jgi:uncharacterized membrane protein YfcA
VADLLVAVVVIVLASAVQGAVGFGLNLLAVPVLLLLDPSFVPGPALAAGLLLSLLVAGREWGALDRQLGWAFLGLGPGTALGLVLLAVVPEDVIGVPLGVLVLVAVGLSALRWQPEPTPPALVVAGAASGFLATAASIGGPPMALLYTRADGAKLRSTLSVFFVAVAAVSLAALAAVGRFDGHDLLVAAAFAPGVLAGFLLSSPLRPLVDRGGARPAILGLSAVAAVAAIGQGLFG